MHSRIKSDWRLFSGPADQLWCHQPSLDLLFLRGIAAGKELRQFTHVCVAPRVQKVRLPIAGAVQYNNTFTLTLPWRYCVISRSCYTLLVNIMSTIHFYSMCDVWLCYYIYFSSTESVLLERFKGNTVPWFLCMVNGIEQNQRHLALTATIIWLDIDVWTPVNVGQLGSVLHILQHHVMIKPVKKMRPKSYRIGCLSLYISNIL